MARILERGDLFLFYRPRVGREQAHGLDDVQRLFLILRPVDRHLYRRLVVGRKRLPRSSRGEKHWAFVERVSVSPIEVVDDFAAFRYQTKAGADRLQSSTRPVGEGTYAVIGHDDHSHFAYRLELPIELGEVQRELGIESAASYIITVRNREVDPRVGPIVGPRVDPIVGPAPGPLPGDATPRRKRRGRPRRFVPLEPAHLDEVGTDLILIASTSELGLDAAAETAHADEILHELAIDRNEHPTEPLFDGEWA